MNNIMLDLETMGTNSNAAIVAIGAVKFGNGQLGDEFYQVVDLQSCVNVGLTIDPSTVMWWMQQSDEARAQFNRTAIPIIPALVQFGEWMEYDPDTQMWGNGAAFDNVILANAYRACGLDSPWTFMNDRCYRTMKAMYPSIPKTRIGTYHNALDDAKTQAVHLMEIWKAMEFTL